VEIKEEGKGEGKEGRREEGMEMKEKGSCAPTKCFISISPVRSFSPNKVE